MNEWLLMTMKIYKEKNVCQVTISFVDDFGTALRRDGIREDV